jgi:hypothetical protein
MLQRDENLREAIRRHDQKQPLMPADLNDRLMKRLEAPPSLPPRGEERTKSLPYWGRLVGAAACLLIIVGVGVTLMMPEEKSNEVALLKPTITVATSESENAAQEVEARETAKVMAAIESKPRARVRRETTLRKEVPLPQEAPQTQTAEPTTTEVAVMEAPNRVDGAVSAQLSVCSQLEPTPAVLTERDIPITRPENYRYTPEEIALLKKQANDAYVKWVQLELEIAKHNLEQTANNYKEQ